MTYQITAERQNAVDFGAQGVRQVLQNVLCILSTPIGSVPLDRDFGVDLSLLDLPIPIAKARFANEAIAAIRKYEPRANIIELGYLENPEENMNGKIIPSVKVEVNL